MQTVRIGVIGLGNMGSHHVTYLSEGGVAGATLGLWRHSTGGPTS